jgi:hypothetical protein
MDSRFVSCVSASKQYQEKMAQFLDGLRLHKLTAPFNVVELDS